jgi:hypothetical protein
MRPMETNELETPPPVIDSDTPRSWFQFSVRDLLIATTIVSICLAIGVHFVGLMFVVAVIGLLQVGVLLAGDWLIRPENRRALAFVTTGSWATLGSGLLVLSLRAIYAAFDARDPSATSTLAISLGVGAALCYLLAAYRWKKLTKDLASKD